MPFLAVGVEHKTAPLVVREQVAMDDEAIVRISTILVAHESIDEVAILSTCNRTEIYLFADQAERAIETVRTLLPDTEHMQVWHEIEAAEHLFRVASGLESQILGEAQILSQVRESLDTAQRLETLGPHVHNLFRSAISCARQARAGTALGRIQTSLGEEAVRAARRAMTTLENRTALLIGGGEICRLVAREMRSDRLGALFIANRTLSVAQQLASETGGTAVRMADISRVVAHADIVISATSAPRYVLTSEDVTTRTKPLHVFDLAVPRDVDPALASVPGVTLHDLDSFLPEGVDGHWDRDIASMESVIAAEVQEFMAWSLTRRIVPVISNLRSHVEAVQQQELKRVAPQLSNLSDKERAAVESMTSRLIDKMFHHLVMRLRLAAQTDPALVDAAEFFFLHGEGGLFEHAAHGAQPAEHIETER
ncbi:MAG: glutamyl-tRNA reductase [Chloroflexota bacterium]